MMRGNHEQLKGTKNNIHSSNLKTFDELPSGNFFTFAFFQQLNGLIIS